MDTCCEVDLARARKENNFESKLWDARKLKLSPATLVLTSTECSAIAAKCYFLNSITGASVRAKDVRILKSLKMLTSLSVFFDGNPYRDELPEEMTSLRLVSDIKICVHLMMDSLPEIVHTLHLDLPLVHNEDLAFVFPVRCVRSVSFSHLSCGVQDLVLTNLHGVERISTPVDLSPPAPLHTTLMDVECRELTLSSPFKNLTTIKVLCLTDFMGNAPDAISIKADVCPNDDLLRSLPVKLDVCEIERMDAFDSSKVSQCEAVAVNFCKEAVLGVVRAARLKVNCINLTVSEKDDADSRLLHLYVQAHQGLLSILQMPILLSRLLVLEASGLKTKEEMQLIQDFVSKRATEAVWDRNIKEKSVMMKIERTGARIFIETRKKE